MDFTADSLNDLTADQAQWIRHIPKVDLHRHLQGSIRTSTLVEISKRFGIGLPSEDPLQLEKFVKRRRPARNLLEFIKPWELFSRIIASPEVIFRITYEAIEDAVKDRVVYLE